MNAIACPHCTRQLKIPPEVAGRTVRCPTCKASFVAGANGPGRLTGNGSTTDQGIAGKPDGLRHPAAGEGEAPTKGQRKRKKAKQRAAAAIPTRVWVIGGAAAGGVLVLVVLLIILNS